jgi:hypothetical protein
MGKTNNLVIIKDDRPYNAHINVKLMPLCEKISFYCNIKVLENSNEDIVLFNNYG